MSTREAIVRDVTGSTAVDFALTFPIFIGLVLGILQVGVLLWMQLGMQNAVEAAVRCAAINTTLCPNAASIQSYAAQNALGLNLPTSTFASTTPACGHQVSASYNYPLFSSNFPSMSLTITAQSCLPI